MQCGKAAGFLAADLIGNLACSYASLIYPEDRDRVWKEVQHSIAERRAVRVTYRILTAADEQKWVWEQAKAIHDESGKPIALEGFITDVTAAKVAEEKIRESEVRFRSVADVVTDAVWDWDMVWDRVWYNEGMQVLLGLPAMPSDPDSSFWTGRVHADDLERIGRQRDEAVRSGQ